MRLENGRRSRRFLLASVAAGLLLYAPATAAAQATDWCSDRSVGRSQHCEVRELTTSARNGTLSIDVGANGSIQVEGYAGSEVRVVARVTARARNSGAAAELASRVEVQARDGEVRATGPRNLGSSGWTVSVRVQVPTGTAIDARTTNGAIDVGATWGAVNVRTTNGSITLADIAGRMEARTTNGSIRASMSAAADMPEAVELRTTNGSVRLAVPEGTSARVNLSTTNGRINTDLPIAVQGTVTRRQLTGMLGNGGPEIRVSTTNGSITISRS